MLDAATHAKIANFYKAGADTDGLAVRYGVSEDYILRIVNGGPPVAKAPKPLSDRQRALKHPERPLRAAEILEALSPADEGFSPDDVALLEAAIVLPQKHTAMDLREATGLSIARIYDARIRLYRSKVLVKRGAGTGTFYCLGAMAQMLLNTRVEINPEPKL